MHLPYLPACSGEKFIFGTLTIVVYIGFVECNVGCCKILTIGRQAVSFMSRLVHLINLYKEKFAF